MRRDLDFDHFLLNTDPRRDLAPGGTFLVFGGLRWRGAFVHAARFDVGAAFKAFQTGDVFPLFGDGLLQQGDLSKQFNQQSLKLWTGQHGEGRWRRHMMQRIHDAESAQEKNTAVPGALLLLRLMLRRLCKTA